MCYSAESSGGTFLFVLCAAAVLAYGKGQLAVALLLIALASMQCLEWIIWSSTPVGGQKGVVGSSSSSSSVPRVRILETEKWLQKPLAVREQIAFSSIRHQAGEAQSFVQFNCIHQDCVYFRLPILVNVWFASCNHLIFVMYSSINSAGSASSWRTSVSGAAAPAARGGTPAAEAAALNRLRRSAKTPRRSVRN